MKAILAVLIIAGILYGAYLMGFGDGKEAEKKTSSYLYRKQKN